MWSTVSLQNFPHLYQVAELQILSPCVELTALRQSYYGTPLKLQVVRFLLETIQLSCFLKLHVLHCQCKVKSHCLVGTIWDPVMN